MEAIVLHRDGKDFKPSAAPLYPNLGQVPPPGPEARRHLRNGKLTTSRYIGREVNYNLKSRSPKTRQKEDLTLISASNRVTSGLEIRSFISWERLSKGDRETTRQKKELFFFHLCNEN